MTAIAFGTKSATLARLRPRVGKARILPLVAFSVERWWNEPEAVLDEIRAKSWAKQRLIVRSSARAEDRPGSSLAGHFRSCADVAPDRLAEAIQQVIASYGPATGERDEVLVQPMLSDVGVSGVAFSQDPSGGGPYLVVNYDETGDTSAVTGGRTDQLKVLVHCRLSDHAPPAPFDAVLELMCELEALFDCGSLDIEFAFDRAGVLYLLQARPLAVATGQRLGAERQRHLLARLAQKIERGSGPHPYLHGRRTVYGIMPDWNPAEIIGIRPRPLALSLYRRLVTDSIWAYQRHNYGYRNLRSFPLMLSFLGQPYIDVRVSFNSFVPSDVSAELAERLVDHYVERLLAKPSLHDKVEFEIVLSCYTLDLPQRLADLRREGFSGSDCETLAQSLRRLTNRIAHPADGLWVQDLDKVRTLDERREAVLAAGLDRVAQIYWLLEDCKRYGTLPFAGLARAGFVAVQMLRSLVAVGAIEPAQLALFMAGLDTVTRRMGQDLHRLRRDAFFARYGHLRPGMYDILSPRYDEAPERYFDWERLSERPPAEPSPESFALTLEQMRRIAKLLVEHGLEMDVVSLFDFIRSSIQGRELAKFSFSRSLSDALSLIAELGAEHGLSREDMAFADIDVIEALHIGCEPPAEVLRRSISQGRAAYAVTRQVLLPPLIASAQQVWSFHAPPSEPNFITRKSAEGRVVPIDGARTASDLDGAILVIPNADPGFDWIFSQGIAGFITAYGGVNSHMAIRASELGLPAVIGAGKSRYDVWQRARHLRLDCANCLVQVVA
jgi:phosphohistidine swiveling domain-containing protein